MDSRELDELLGSVAAGRTGVAEARDRIAMAPIRDIGYATLDTSRELRQGQGEVVYGAGKTAGQIAGIVRALTGAGQRRVLVTRLDAEKNDEVRRLLSGEVELEYDPTSRLGVVGGNAPATGAGRVVVACAGTSDLPVAEEAARTCEFLGNDVCRLTDVGVAGIHRLLDHADAIASASDRKSVV